MAASRPEPHTSSSPPTTPHPIRRAIRLRRPVRWQGGWPPPAGPGRNVGSNAPPPRRIRRGRSRPVPPPGANQLSRPRPRTTTRPRWWSSRRLGNHVQHRARHRGRQQLAWRRHGALGWPAEKRPDGRTRRPLRQRRPREPCLLLQPQPPRRPHREGRPLRLSGQHRRARRLVSPRRPPLLHRRCRRSRCRRSRRPRAAPSSRHRQFHRHLGPAPRRRRRRLLRHRGPPHSQRPHSQR
jgi:hypothetical protein